MRSLEEKLSAVEELFNRGCKSFQVAVEIVRKGRDVTMDERALMVEKIGCSLKTVGYVLTRLRKAGLYGSYDEPLTTQKPQKTQEDEKEKEEPPKETKEETKEPEPEVEEPKEKYVTIDQFNRLVEEIRVISGITPIQELEPEDYVEEPYEAPTPESVDLEDASLKQMGTWVEHKNMIYFDFAKNGAFGGALEGFGKNKKGEKIPSSKLWSDFVNVVIDDYFKVVHNVGLGLLSRRFA